MDSVDAIRKGWIIKKVHGSQYTYRYLVLDVNALRLFSKLPGAEADTNAVDECIKVDSIRSLVHIQSEDGQGNNGFILDTESVQHEFRCQSVEETESWTRDIKQFLSRDFVHKTIFVDKNPLYPKFRRSKSSTVSGKGVLGAINLAVVKMKRHVHHKEAESSVVLNGEQIAALQRYISFVYGNDLSFSDTFSLRLENLLMNDSILMNHVASAVLDSIEHLPNESRSERAKQVEINLISDILFSI